MNPPRLFTIARIAQELGRSRQYVYLSFAGTRPDGQAIVRGQRANGWLEASFPKEIFDRLEAIRIRKGLQSIAELLAAPLTRYIPTVPFNEVAPAERQKALKLRHALAPFFPRHNEKNLAKGGVVEYQRIFGYSITERHWRNLFNRTLERDGGRHEWERPELYLPQKPARITTARAVSTARESSLDVLEDALSTLSQKGTLTVESKDYLWIKACDQLQLAINEGAKARRTKRAILKTLLASGFFGSNGETIRRNFDHQWQRYLANGGKIVDGRRLRDQRRPWPNEDKQKVVARALDCGGRLSQSFRELRDAGELSDAAMVRTISNARSKSHVPTSLRREAGPEVDRLMPLHRGEREFALSGPYVPQDYSRIAAGHAYQLDDVTLPIWYWEIDPESPGGLFFGRGQWILAIDVRSLLVLGHALHSSPAYNMRIVRSLLLRIHDDYGLPESLILERGIWRTAKIMKGDELDVTYTEQGLREFGVAFHHRTKPRGKIIERVIGLLQNRMERLPGYCGRNERTDHFERVQEHILAVQSGREHPSKYFLSKAQWLQELDAILADHNREPQNGRLDGRSPVEEWNRCVLPQGTVHLGAKARYLLAHHRRPVKVQRSGIRLPPSLGGGLYYNANSGRFVGQQMVAWINPEQLDAICLTSLDRRDGPYMVERAEPLSPIGASGEKLQSAHEQIAAHNDYTRTQYRTIQPHLVRRNFRRLWRVDQTTVELGEKIASSTEEIIQARRARKRATKSARRLVRQQGMNVEVNDANAERKAEAAVLMREAFEESGERSAA